MLTFPDTCCVPVVSWSFHFPGRIFMFVVGGYALVCAGDVSVPLLFELLSCIPSFDHLTQLSCYITIVVIHWFHGNRSKLPSCITFISISQTQGNSFHIVCSVLKSSFSIYVFSLFNIFPFLVDSFKTNPQYLR